MYTTQVTLLDADGWKLTSYGRGAAYLLEHKPSSKSVFFQGDDADIFRSEFDTRGSDAFTDYQHVLS